MAASWYYAISLWPAAGINCCFYPIWNGDKAILRHVNPYSSEVTEQNQTAVYGTTSKALGIAQEQRFSYPIFATFPIIPLGLLGFRTANEIVFWVFAALTALSVGWLRGRWDSITALYSVLAFSSYPIIFALQTRQPTFLFFGLAVGSFALLRSGHLIPAALLAALSAGKPQIAIPVLLPMLIYTMARWHERKRFAISLVALLLGLISVSSIISPGWITEWLATLRVYSQTQPPSLAVSWFGREIGLAVSALLCISLIAALWLHRESDLLFQVASSVAILHLVVPYGMLNAVVLLVPAVWVADNAPFISACGALSQLTLATVRITIIGSWALNAVCAVLWPIHSLGILNLAGWVLQTRMVLAVIASLAALMIVQCVTKLRPFIPEP